MKAPILHAAATLGRYLRSCTNEVQYSVADQMLTRFALMYQTHPLASVVLTELQLTAQLVRIDLQLSAPPEGIVLEPSHFIIIRKNK